MKDLQSLAGRRGIGVDAGGWHWLITPLTLREMARLEAWVEAHAPHPMRAAAEQLAALPAELREVAVKESVKATYRDWPPAYGGEVATKLLYSTMRGRAEVLQLVLDRPANSGNLDAETLLDAITEDEFAALAAALHGLGPHDPAPPKAPAATSTPPLPTGA